MTPDKGKKPLPSSTSIAFLEQPQTLHEWQYVLKFIKVEHQKGQWKQCLKSCNLLLGAKFSPLPLHVACLHFYAALSEEAIARQMHEMSLARIEALQHVKMCFEQAAMTLPVPDKLENSRDVCSGDSGSEVDDTASLEDSVSSFEDCHPNDVTGSPSSKRLEQPPLVHCAMKPLPLRICKTLHNEKASFNDKRAFFESRVQTSKSSPSVSPKTESPSSEKPLPATPPPPLKRRQLAPSKYYPKPASLLDSPTTVCFRSPAQQRYHRQLEDFGQMLAKHIYFVDEAIAKTKEAQATGRRRLIKERKLGSDEADENKFDLGARIARLRKKGWARERFVPGKYQELCEKALAEL